MIRALYMLVAVGVATAAPALKDNPGPYFPSRVGDTRVYESRATSGTYEVTETVVRVEGDGPALLIHYDWACDGESRGPATVRLSDAGVFRVLAADGAGPPARPILRFPLHDGATWAEERPADPFGAPAYRATFKVGRAEDVEVPAGRFRAVRVEVTETVADVTYRTRQWYAPRVG